ncbi:DNA gyrase C-terminal beta-propeller domain-containing protein, partial [Neptunomonas sp.]|uniref:DNA gyrase C-terminal beta-propeller domain-containing protein n=1 Tax=Neptunomonas sp. TaxID=1971898 RepID=UPI0035660D47
SQRRGGKGKSVTAVKDEDFVEHLLIASTHATILCFTNKGKIYWLKVYEIPQASRAARGRPIVNILPLDEGERISTILPVNEYSEDRFVFMATASGTVKKTSLVNFSRPRSSGLIAVDLLDDDALIGAAITEGDNDILLVTDAGKVARFHEADVRAMGRTARGVRGVKMKGTTRVISLIIPKEGGKVLTASIRGFGKQTAVEDFPCKGRGNQGVIGMQCTDRNGVLAGAVQVFEGDDVMLISDQGTMVRTRTSEISVLGRNTQGVMLIRVAGGENLVSLARIEEPEVIDIESDEGADSADNSANDIESADGVEDVGSTVAEDVETDADIEEPTDSDEDQDELPDNTPEAE